MELAFDNVLWAREHGVALLQFSFPGTCAETLKRFISIKGLSLGLFCLNQDQPMADTFSG